MSAQASPEELNLANALPDGMIKIDAEGTILWVNQKATELFSMDNAADVCGQNVLSVLKKGDMVVSLRQLRDQAIEWVSPVDQKIALSLQILPYGHAFELLQARDISQRFQHERMRQDLVANVSHELRTPLTVIHGYLEVLNDWDNPTQPPREIVQQLYQQSTRMERLVSDLLLLSRLEASSLMLDHSHSVSLSALLPSIVEEAKALSGKRNHIITLEFENPDAKDCMIQGSADELRSAISNLVFNAVNYTPPGGHVTVKYASQDGAIVLSVSDTGIGIDPQHIPRLTERFYRIDKGRSRDSGGTGLGLAIVKHVMIRHQAKLEIDSEVGQGSTFRCIFPQSLSLAVL